MRVFKLCLFLCLMAIPSFSQGTYPALATNNTFTGTNEFNGASSFNGGVYFGTINTFANQTILLPTVISSPVVTSSAFFGFDGSFLWCRTTMGGDCLSVGSGVGTFNGRAGGVVLLSGDVTTALGYTPQIPISWTGPLAYSSGTASIIQATTSANGYLSSTDWNTFNGKQGVLSWTAPLASVGTTISIVRATTSVDGYLSSTDWNTFNGKAGGGGSWSVPGAIGLVTPNTGSFTSVNVSGQLVSTIATGSSPFGVVSTTPVANLTTSPITRHASGSQVVNARMVFDNCDEGSTCNDVTLTGASAFTSNLSYDCWARDDTTPASNVSVTRNSGSSITFIVSGGGDSIHYLCVGN